jgi:hypothetical protein
MSTEMIVALITALLSSVIGPIAIHWIKEWAEKQKRDKNPIFESLRINQMITEKLECIKEDYEAARVWLIQFHNGGNFYPTGKSIQKFSMVYEILDSSVVPCQHQFQNIPVSLFSKSINDLSEDKNIVIRDIDSEEVVMAGFTTVIVGAGVKSSYIFPISNIKGDFVGIVGVDYVGTSKGLDDHDINLLELEVSTIGGVLNNYLKQ